MLTLYDGNMSCRMNSGWSADVEIKGYMTTMKFISKEALPGAVVDTLNNTAQANERKMKKNVEKRMIVRTPYTLKSIKQDRHARGQNIARMFSRVGSISPYLAIHDEGGIVQAENKKIPIPTLQARTGKNIRKRIARRYKMNEMDIGSNFFMGKPASRRLGIYERRKHRMVMIRNLESSQKKIDPNRWFSDSLKKYGTPQYIRAQFIRAAKKRLKRVQ